MEDIMRHNRGFAGRVSDWRNVLCGGDRHYYLYAPATLSLANVTSAW
jgi:hypothetical protein